MCSLSEVRAAGFVIIRRISQSIEYLLLQTSYGEHHWTPPKGHVEPGENDLETAYRETKEEAGIDKMDLLLHDFKHEMKYTAHNKPKVVVYWLAEVKLPSVDVSLSDEHQDFKWATLDLAKELSKFPEMVKLLQECEDFLRQK